MSTPSAVDAGKRKARGIRQTRCPIAVDERVRHLSRAIRLQSDRAERGRAFASSAIAAAASSAAFPKATIEATFSVPARRAFSWLAANESRAKGRAAVDVKCADTFRSVQFVRGEGAEN